MKTEESQQKYLPSTLGLASLALGSSELLMTDTVAEASGLDSKYRPILQAFGTREIVSGIGLLLSENKYPWLWSRVIGDLLDTAFLGWAFANEEDEEKQKKIVIAFLSISPIVMALINERSSSSSFSQS